MTITFDESRNDPLTVSFANLECGQAFTYKPGPIWFVTNEGVVDLKDGVSGAFEPGDQVTIIDLHIEVRPHA